jgi:CDP-glucose 4,6-dehydratase
MQLGKFGKKKNYMAFNNIYKNKKVLITGNTGFKGSWLSTWLKMMGAEVYGYSVDIPTQPSMFEILDMENKISHHFGNICERRELEDYVQKVKPDFIFHLAAQAIVSISYEKPYDTIMSNVMGTASVLEAIRNIKWKCTCILITSDKAYDNVEWIWGYRENDSMGGKDIYSGSKGAAELIIKSYWHSFIRSNLNIKIGIARAGNVIGGGDWAVDRIVVDCVDAFCSNKIVEIRSPKATRPWQHVLEPLSGYLILGQYLFENKVNSGEAFNFGPRAEQTKTVFELAQDLAEYWGINKDKAIMLTDDIPFNEANLLKLNCDKALANLNWHSTLDYEQCVRFIADWYRSYYVNKDKDMYQLTMHQIELYIVEAIKQNAEWAKL